MGDRSQRPHLDRVHAAEGFDFSENSIGTNWLGTALVEGRPIYVEGSQHFSEFLAPLTCAAVPVMAPGGSAVGSFSMGAEVKAANALMLPLSKEIGHQIEQRLRAQTQCHVAKVDLAVGAGHRRGVKCVSGGSGVISGRG